MNAYIFIDTNLALHYRRPDEINWIARTGAAKVYLVATPTFITELERQKIHNQSERLRDRADKYLRYLRPYIQNHTRLIRQDVYWNFIPTEPQCNFRAHGLHQDVHDDWLIAQALEFDPGPNGQIFFATNDTTLLMKVQHRGFSIVPLYDEDALPAEPDPAQKEAKQLRQRLAKYESRLPALHLVPDDGGSFMQFHIPTRLPPTDTPSLAEIKEHHPKMHLKNQTDRAASGHQGDIAKISQEMQNVGISPRRIERYNEELEIFYQAYSDYLSNLEHWREYVRLTNEVRLVLTNDGTTSATNIDVFLDFPEDLTLYEPSDCPQRPKEPEPPKRPSTTTISEMRGLIDPLSTRFPGLDIPRTVDVDGDPVVTQARNQVAVRVRNLKHGHQCAFDPFHISFENADSVRSFTIQYTITAHEIPEPVKENLNVVVNTDPDS